MSGTRRKPGRLGPYVDGYRCRLLELGYTTGTVRGQLKVLGQLGRWMASEGLESAQLNTSTIEAFLGARRAIGYLRVPTMRSFASLVDYLRDEGVLGAEDPGPPLTLLDELIGKYTSWKAPFNGHQDGSEIQGDNRNTLRTAHMLPGHPPA